MWIIRAIWIHTILSGVIVMIRNLRDIKYKFYSWVTATEIKLNGWSTIIFIAMHINQQLYDGDRPDGFGVVDIAS